MVWRGTFNSKILKHFLSSRGTTNLLQIDATQNKHHTKPFQIHPYLIKNVIISLPRSLLNHSGFL